MVGISLLTLVPGVVGGSETYARSICRALYEHGELDYMAYLPTLAPDAAGPLPAKVIDSYPASHTTPGRLAALARARLAPHGMIEQLRADTPSLVHFPLTTEIPRMRGVSSVVTVHDLQHLLIPSFFSHAERLYRRLLYAPAIRRAAAVIAISSHVKETVIELLGVPAERIWVAHHGIDHEILNPARNERDPERFVLYPANRWPHKNHELLLEAFRMVRTEQPDLRLVLTGFGHDGASADSGVDVLGHVPRQRLVQLFQTATALVFPSLYEGFGQPPLEAMACGCPVACSDAAALPEVCGDAAVYFDPHDATSIADGIARVLAHHETYRERGLRHAAEFTWERSAQAHESAYRSAGAAPTRLI